MSSFTVLIPSKTLSNVSACIRQLRNMGETADILVIDDGLVEDSPMTDPDCLAITTDSGVGMVSGIRPFIFARNINIGLRETSGDVVIMGDDALLETPGGLSLLADFAGKNPEYGILAAAVDSCGTPNQMHSEGKRGLRLEKVQLAFICVYIPRWTIGKIGYLDESFGINAGGEGSRGYGCEDDDYCWRVRQAGLKLGVVNDVFVNHTSLPSTFRHDKEHPADVRIHERLFEKKWGRHPRRPIDFS